MSVPTPAVGIEYFASWLASGERGISSEAIVSQLTRQQVGSSYRGDDHPYDPSDFRRCELLLRQCPLARLVFPAEMPKRSRPWAALVAVWDELVTLIESEVPDAFSSRYPTGGAPLAYARMKAVLASAEPVSA